MWKKTLLTMALAILLSSCATLYSTSRNWQLPGGLGGYALTAKMDIGFFTRVITISVNGRELLTGQTYFWSDSITMSGTINNLPLNAVCSVGSKKCAIAIAGIHAVTLNF